MMGDILPWMGTFCPNVDCPGGHCTLVQNVRGDIAHFREDIVHYDTGNAASAILTNRMTCGISIVARHIKYYKSTGFKDCNS